MTQIVSSLAEISADYDALFVDLWGCVHDGVAALPDAVAALQAVRKTGVTVVLLTNSPRPRAQVRTQLDGFGVPTDAWDTIATSGDSARAAMFQGIVGHRVFHIGEPHDDPFFEPLQVLDNPQEIHRVALEDAEGIVCTGPFDPNADPAVLRPQLLLAKTMGLKLLCANPDIVVDRGDHREWCAGAVAKLYTEMGGESLYFGKPHPPIYDLARLRLTKLGKDIPNGRILAIGDGIHTDIQGALGEGIDSLFITGGLAAAETRTADQPDADALNTFIEKEKMTPTYAIGKLR
ncbi:TIGR01459 family HAD-type hydrolase [Pseudooceanicola sediminis]|uniref:TIGR01459 family HAD-type hydrolase n=1 Tax=Pseudooceanicola sediminis TaxID=2211117 RepID=A0A399J0J4_9RHOB|nr:TIGR01459 family HAD-type hydrolase [Pseudooceanicola sediminis]KAA2312341.1 TIGR01459 family HAD-type hydrolase [Puniceibacterium sp. HSS470]RII37392.1 TIGR01459 family HAD-type hydrolase [Pseudooceanicola sediminis]|tara:strand:+ start:10180 stop:11052 length:873 start_codon:yes stop_codon:yes gene_type:complete